MFPWTHCIRCKKLSTLYCNENGNFLDTDALVLKKSYLDFKQVDIFSHFHFFEERLFCILSFYELSMEAA